MSNKWSQRMHLANQVRDEHDLYRDLVVALPEEDAKKATNLIFRAKNADIDITQTRRLVGEIQQKLVGGSTVDRDLVLESLLSQRVVGCTVHGADDDLVHAADRLHLLMRENEHGDSMIYGEEAAQILTGVFAS